MQAILKANRSSPIPQTIFWITVFIAIGLLDPVQAQSTTNSSDEKSTQAASQSAADYSDQVILKNGSVIKGTIVYVEKDSLLLETDSFDPVKISVWKIQSIKTTSKVDVVLDNGKRWRGRISTNQKGEMVLEPYEGGKDRQLNFGFIDGIYHMRPAWDNKMTIGGSQTTGSSDVLGFSISGTSTRDSEKDRLTLLSQLTYAEASGQLVEDNWSGTVKYDYFFRPRMYLALAEEIKHDKMQDLKLRTVTSGSLGYNFVRKPETLFEVELGIGAMTEQFYKSPDDSFVALRGGVNANTAIGDKITVSDVLVMYVSDGTDRIQGVNTFKLDLELTHRWGLEIANIINHYSGPSFISTDDPDIKWTIGVSSKF